MVYLLTAVLLIQPLSPIVSAEDTSAQSSSSSVSTDTADIDTESQTNGFYKYLQSIKEYPAASETITLDAAKATLSAANASATQEYLGENNVVTLDENGYAEWKFTANEDAVYCITLEYATIGDNLRNPQAEFLVDGNVPYDSAAKLELNRLWKDSDEEKYDERGNQLSYDVSEVKQWQTVQLYDNEGIMHTEQRVYLTKGEHVFRFESLRDSFAVKKVTLAGEKTLPTYEQLSAEYAAKGYQKSTAPLQKFQAEKIEYKSDQELSAVSDRSNPAVEPYDVSKIRQNVVGGSTWEKNGQWVQYSFDVPESGLYAVSFKFKQSLQTGMATCRSVSIDGEIPCQEFENVRFDYSVNWQNITVSDKNGSPCYIYLEAGTHTMRVEATPGIWSDLLQSVNESYYDLAAMYREIIMITGTNPDTLRDYSLDSQIPDLVSNCTAYADSLYTCADQFDQINGSKASQSETLRRMADQLKSFAQKPDTIATRIKEFRDNLTGISQWLLTVENQPLLLDYYMLSSDPSSLPKPMASALVSVTDAVKGFVASFTTDYDSIGVNQKDAIEVWVNAGRDYANIIKNMIDNDFTPKTGVKVNLSMVQGVIVEATLAGTGPEICIEEARSMPVNLASRGAMVNLKQFDNYSDVASRFSADSLVPYQYGDGSYALPLSQQYFMMFYRTDIFKQLGLSVPNTWQEFMDAAKLLQRKNMEVCLPYSSVTAVGAEQASIGAKDMFSTLLLQNGGSFYNSDMSASGLDSQAALNAFKMWTDFYAKYDYPLTMDFTTRFRTGEVPLGVMQYQEYCALQAIAPEIRGLWKMTLVPGTQKDDGSIDRSVGATGTCISIFKKAAEKNQEQPCWQFLDWFTNDDTQYTYASTIEARQGEAGRYTTANLNAFQRLSWTRDELNVLNEQRSWIKEVPEDPGSYYVSRCIDNAFRSVIYRQTNPRDTLDKQNKLINDELQRKHEELANRK